MARSTYAIRQGFEYQDLYCATQLLQYMLESSLDARFDIESDEATHVDDLVLKLDNDTVEGHQVKFHVNQDHVESFETLTARKTKKSKSLIEKLYSGWERLAASGCSHVTLTFISSNPAEKGRFKLGPAIATSTGKFNDKFFTHNDYEKWRRELSDHLSTDSTGLKEFLDAVAWRFSYESIEGLKCLITRSLRQLRLPNDEDAFARLIEVVGHIATTPFGEQASVGSSRSLGNHHVLEMPVNSGFLPSTLASVSCVERTQFGLRQ